MEDFLTNILLWFAEFFQGIGESEWFSRLQAMTQSYRYGWSKFLNENYYETLFERYFSVAGFIAGLVLIVLIVFASVSNEKKTNIFRVIAGITVVISSSSIYNNLIMIIRGVGMDSLQASQLNLLRLIIPNSDRMDISVLVSHLSAANNILSGLLLTLIIYASFKNDPVCAFLMGVLVYATPSLMSVNGGDDFIWYKFVFSVVSPILAGILCANISTKKYFFNGWIWYFGFHILSRIIWPYITVLIGSFEGIRRYGIGQYTRNYVNMVWNDIPNHIIDTVFFVVILVFAILYERFVIFDKNAPEESPEEAPEQQPA